MPIAPWKLALLFGLLACSHNSGDKRDATPDTLPPDLDGQAEQILDVPGSDLAVTPKSFEDGGAGGDGEVIGCRTDKLEFSQETGCRNDDAVEFCMPANDALVLSQVKAIAPTLVCAPGGGRAGCQPGITLLCQLPLSSAQCPQHSDPMPDAVWLSVCRIAALDAVTKIVPTWYE